MQGKYSRTKLVSYIVEQLQSNAKTDELVKSVAAYLLDNNKANDLQSVMRDAQELRAQKYGAVEVTAASAHELGSAQLAEIESVVRGQYAAAKDVTIHTVQDESVVGGTIVTLPQATLDVSVRSKLNQLREAIS